MSAYYREESALATEVRRIISKLKIANEERGVKVVMVTSSGLGEGKSTVATYLAIAYSKYRNTKTVIVDFDLRRPRVHSIFELEKKNGVAEILKGKVPVKACLRDVQYPNLQVVTCGRRAKECTSEVLNSPRVQDFFSELRFYHDLIIVDAPPVIPVSDPLMLGSEIDGSLFVIKAGKTQKPVIKRAIQLLRDARVDILGLILNNVHHALPYYYDYDFYKYEYYDYREKKKSKSKNSADGT